MVSVGVLQDSYKITRREKGRRARQVEKLRERLRTHACCRGVARTEGDLKQCKESPLPPLSPEDQDPGHQD